MNNSITHRICEDISDAIIMAEAADVVDSWRHDLNVTLSSHPVEPTYSIFQEFYELAGRLRQEYSPTQIEDARQEFHYRQQREKLHPLPPFSYRSREIKIIEDCFVAIEKGQDLGLALEKGLINILPVADVHSRFFYVLQNTILPP